jgi:hypothetical protein
VPRLFFSGAAWFVVGVDRQDALRRQSGHTITHSFLARFHMGQVEFVHEVLLHAWPIANVNRT